MEAPFLEKSVLTIAGSDSCGGAGVQADMNTFAAFGVYGASVITAVTARNTLGVQAVEPVSDFMIIEQMESVLQDLPVRAIKTGMLPSIAGIAILREILERQAPRIPMVVDPVVIEPRGKELTGDTVLAAIQNHLFPLATVVTPNLQEAEILTGMEVSSREDMEIAAAEIMDRGPSAVFLKGGRFAENEVTDLLVTPDGMHHYIHRAFEGRFHGTGCALSSAIAAGLAAEKTLPDAVRDAVDYVQICLQQSLSPKTGRVGLLGHRPPGN